MKRIVVIGHGGYAEGVKQNLEMIIGESEHMYFVDLTKEDDLASLENKISHLLESFNEDEVLFTCDLLGASPFRVAAMQCMSHPEKYYAVTGLNTMGFIELSMGKDLPMEELINRAIEATKDSIKKFPE